jgi:hypothetical protein
MPDCGHSTIIRCNAVGPSGMQLETATKCSTTFAIAQKLLGYRLHYMDTVQPGTTTTYFISR